MPTDSTNPSITQLLIECGSGDRNAVEELLPVVYQELRRLAAAYMRRERSDHTLQPTALVHEAYVRLIDQRRVDWKDRAHFFGIAAETMRRILVNYARDRKAAKRGGGARKITISAAEHQIERQDVNLLALDEALQQLSHFDQRKSRVVELKFFGGMTTEEITEVLGISVATVEREWRFARAWLFEQLAGTDIEEDSS